MRTLKPSFRIISFLLLYVSLASCATPSESILGTETQIQAPSITNPPFTSTATLIPPTATETQKPTNTLTPTKTETLIPTSTATHTYTQEPARLTINTDTVCMKGASFGHGVLHYVSVGTDYSIRGQLLDRSWWLVDTDNDDSCWIFGEYATVTGDVQALPLMTPPPLPSQTPTVTPENPGIYYILIAKDTGGPFGCGDSLIRYYPGVWIKGDMSDDIKGALNALFANHQEYTNGLYNPIYQSSLKAKSVEKNGEVKVYLAGQLVRPKDKCESQRMHDQVWYTVSQFSHSRAIIYLNNALLGDLLVVAK